MKKSVKRVLALLMAASSASALLVGCGGSAATTTSTAPETSAAATSESAAATTTEAEYGPVMTRMKETGKMVVATASGYMPYEFVDISSADAKVIGVDMALGQKIADKVSEELGTTIEMQIEDTTFTANLAAVAADQVDIMLAGMSPTAERKENMDFSDVYLAAEQRVMVRKEDAEKYTDISAFDGKVIAVQKNTTQEKVAKELITGATVTSLEKIPIAVLELTTGKADGVVIESTVAQPYLIANPDLVLADAEFAEDRRYKDTAIAVPKGGNDDFLAIINEVIKECKDSGEIDKWIAEYSEICAKNNAA